MFLITVAFEGVIGVGVGVGAGPGAGVVEGGAELADGGVNGAVGLTALCAVAVLPPHPIMKGREKAKSRADKANKLLRNCTSRRLQILEVVRTIRSHQLWIKEKSRLIRRDYSL